MDDIMKNAEKIIKEYPKECKGLTPEKMIKKVRYLFERYYDSFTVKDLPENLRYHCSILGEVIYGTNSTSEQNVSREQIAAAITTLQKIDDAGHFNYNESSTDENNNIDFGKPVFLGQVENKHPYFGGEGPLYAFYCSYSARTPDKEFLFYQAKPDQALLAFTKSEDFDGHPLRLVRLDNKDRDIIEYFITSDNPEKRKFLQNVLQDMENRWYEGLMVGDISPAFNKLRAEYEHEKLNESKLAQLRKAVAKGIDDALGTNLEEKKLAKPLKKIEKAVSDKLLGKVKD